MFVQVEKYVGHGKTRTWFLNSDHIVSISEGDTNHIVVIGLSGGKQIEVSGDLETVLNAIARSGIRTKVAV